MTDLLTMTDGTMTASVSAEGAELRSVQDASGHEFMWQAGPEWPRHAPILFPIVGRLKGDALHHLGHDYRLTQHGFARDSRFGWSARERSSCSLVLTDDSRTRAMYPFAFRFEVGYALDAEGLLVTFAVTNTGNSVLPASFGGHPAFKWPIEAERDKKSYSLSFEVDEPEGIRSVANGLLTSAVLPSPLRGQELSLAPELFANDALIFEAPHSRHVTLGTPAGRWLRMEWENFPQLGIWSRDNAGFVCIEPWAGMASPEGFDGEFVEKPWLMLIEPGETRSAWFRISVGES